MGQQTRPLDVAAVAGELKLKIFAVTFAFLVLTLSACVSSAEEDGSAGPQGDKLRQLGQRLVRRNFLRFGKRSGSPPATEDESQLRQQLQQAGPGEQYELMLMSGKHPHKSKTRSFLRFGKRAENFLRFGKANSMMQYAGKPPQPMLAEPAAYVGAAGGDWEQKLLAMLSRLDREEDDEEGQQQYAKKSNDFLRFG